MPDAPVRVNDGPLFICGHQGCLVEFDDIHKAAGREYAEKMRREEFHDCTCQARDARVCWMIRRGEHPTRNPKCSCPCHSAPPSGATLEGET